MYLTYEEYSSKGGKLDISAFELFERRAENTINAQSAGKTGVRLSKLETVPQAVKDCVYDLIQYLSNNADFTQIVASESQSSGGVSESVSYVNKTDSQINKDCENIIYDVFYSNNLGWLLVRGFTQYDLE